MYKNIFHELFKHLDRCTIKNLSIQNKFINEIVDEIVNENYSEIYEEYLFVSVLVLQC